MDVAGVGALFSADTVSWGHATLKHALQPHNRTLQLGSYDTVDDVVNRFDFIQSREYRIAAGAVIRRGGHGKACFPPPSQRFDPLHCPQMKFLFSVIGHLADENVVIISWFYVENCIFEHDGEIFFQ